MEAQPAITGRDARGPRRRRPPARTLAVVAVAAFLLLSSGALILGSVASRTNSPRPSAGAFAPASGGSSGWSLLSATGGPGPRAGFGFAYDGAIGKVVLFGGCAGGDFYNFSCSPSNDTWTYVGGTWTQVSTPVAPSPRVDPSMVYDAADGYILLYGGGSGSPNYLSFNDTWTFNGVSWTELTPANHPSAGLFGSMIYDGATSKVVYYDSGEEYAGGPFLNDTWTFSAGAWTRVLVAAGPSPRGTAGFDFASAGAGSVLFGGNTCSNSTGLCPNHNDTWTYGSTGWTNVTPLSKGNGPSARNSMAMAFDPIVNASILFGGHLVGTYYGDTWAFQNNRWNLTASNVSPSASMGAREVFDAADSEFLLYGGYSDSGGGGLSPTYYGSLWEFGNLTPPPPPPPPPPPLPTNWSVVNSTNTPAARAGFGFVYDPALGKVVMFGGCVAGDFFNFSCTPTNETWTYSGGAWMQVHTSTAPAARVLPAMTYDATDGYVLLFGGGSGFPNYLSYGDTWAFNGTAWTQLSPSVHPSASPYARMAYDPALGEVILFDDGETYHGGPFLNATWTFSGGSWTRILNGVGPSPRAEEYLTYDPASRSVVMFGGNVCSNVTGSCPNLEDTWSFANDTWSDLTNSVSPGMRNAGAFAWDAAANVSVLYGGHLFTVFYNDTWEYSHGGWTLVPTRPTPPAMIGPGFVYDAADREVLLFGGWNSSGGGTYSATLWTVGGLPSPPPPPPPPANYWTAIPTASAPSARAGFGFAYDPGIGKVVLFGGCVAGLFFNLSCTPANDTWTYSNGTWTELHPVTAPSARVQPQMAYDAADGYLVLYGGGSGFPNYLAYGDTWEFNGTDWVLLHPHVHPSPGAYGALTWDAAAGALVLFESGQVYHGGPFLNNTWTFAAGQWTRVLTNSGPSPRGDEAFTYDPSAGSAILFGGNACSNATGLCPNNMDTWTYTNGSWSNANPAVAPAARNSASFAYDPALGASVLFGGHLVETYYNDVWTYSGGVWTPLPSLTSPSPRMGAGLVWDAADREMVMFGGYLNAGWEYDETLGVDTFYNGTWAFGLSTPPAVPEIVGLTAAPAPIRLGGSAVLTAEVTARTTVTYAWSGLPTGCVSMDTSLLVCTPTETGNFSVILSVTNPSGIGPRATVVLEIVPVPLPTKSPAGGSPGTPAWESWAAGAAVGALVVAAAAAVSLSVRRRRQREGEALGHELEGPTETPPPP